MSLVLAKPVTEYIEASNTFDGDRLLAAFSDDALVNDARREFWGREAIARWSSKEIIGDKVTMQVTENQGALRHVHCRRGDGRRVRQDQPSRTFDPDPLLLGGRRRDREPGDNLNSGPRER